MAFQRVDDYLPNINPYFGFTICDYFSSFLGSYPYEKLFGPWSVFQNPLLENLGIMHHSSYDLTNILLFPHFISMKFIGPAGFGNWFVEGYTAYYQNKSLYESGNCTLRMFNESLLTSKWNYENLIFNNSDEVSLHDLSNIWEDNNELYFQIAEDKTTLVAFLLDREIRNISFNNLNIDDFTKYLYDNYWMVHLNDSEKLLALNTFINFDFTNFFDRYIFGLEKLPLDDYLRDDDGDGLLNFTEDDLGTNREISDTDGDGVNDALENYYYLTDPLNSSSCPNLEKWSYQQPSKTTAECSNNNRVNIIIDGCSDDWNNVPILFNDAYMDFGGFEYDDADISSIKTTIKNDKLYMYIDFYAGHSRTIAYDILLDTYENSGSYQFEYALRYDIFGNSFLYDVTNRNPEEIINFRPFGIIEVHGACKDILEVSVPLSLIGSPTSKINVEVKTVDCVQVLTVNSPSMINAKLLPYLIGDTAKFSIILSLEPPSNLKVSDIPNDNGHQLKLTWNTSPSENDGYVDWYRIYRSRSNILTDPIPLTQFTSIDSLNFYDQHYTILIDSVAAGTTEYIDECVPLNNVPYYYWLQAVVISMESQKIAANIVTFVENIPLEFHVNPPYPNPFNPYTTIEYHLPFDCHVELVIYDILGRNVAVLENRKLDAGIHKTVWNGESKDGTAVGSGVYLYLLKADKYISRGKMLLIR